MYHYDTSGGIRSNEMVIFGKKSYVASRRVAVSALIAAVIAVLAAAALRLISTMVRLS